MKSSTVASRRRERSTPKSLRERQPESASAVSRSVLLGIVPVLIPAPPTLPSFSTSATRFPKIAAVLAPQMPAGPPPMTTRSKLLVIDARDRGEAKFWIAIPIDIEAGCEDLATRHNGHRRRDRDKLLVHARQTIGPGCDLLWHDHW